MFRALSRGLSVVFCPATLKILFLSFLITIGCFAIIWYLAGYIFLNNSFFESPWLENISDALSGVALLIATWFLFPSVLSASVVLFLDQLAGYVEKKYYPALAPTPEISIVNSLMPFLRFFLVLISLNVLLLSLLIFFAPAFPFVFFIVNGYLISREYFELVAIRRFPINDVTKMRKRHTWKLGLFGILITALLMVPFLNLIAPILATSIMVHLIEEWKNL